ncbi:MAG: polyprenyl diphosphate synthase [Gammaproteobacteria bacterium]|nr:di-trans,poly-cis-decaprenylcistransferase [Gammaproteobacteria bacterium]MBQ08466.1 di-trans,poly-cis-decaprenylcistransferase [Gammaproteobacteria bacterium]MDP6146813.1 polyprenyl diphosphate synthase [Gammaproteobacteria bacterium]HJM09171.1 polyprenyl diphosphate synthase [Gammaproteobacteria bacterium]|tara:strand:- start:1972 stop:2733 length:762 start_codon:yes stop_codon:yes gene_type:complete
MSSSQESYLNPNPNQPRHVGIIMDGNGRWAKLRGKRRIFGHEAGVLKARELVETAVKIELEALTLYAFSSENWSRPKKEVSGLMRLFEKTIEKYTSLLINNNVRFKAVGDPSKLPRILKRKLEQMESITSQNTGLILTLAIAYGGQQEIVSGIKRLIEDHESQIIDANEITVESFKKYLLFQDLPDLDLMIRTSGETRISNFMLWQSAYSEIHFTETLWPNFEEQEFLEILQTYSQSERRFGNVEEDIELKKA